MRRCIAAVLLLCCLLVSAAVPAAAGTEDAPLPITVTAGGTPLPKLTDGVQTTAQKLPAGELRLQSNGGIGAVYIIFDALCTDWGVVTPQGKHPLGEGQFLHAFADLTAVLPGQPEQITLYFGAETAICEIYAFAGAQAPGWVQVWQPPCEQADLLLLSSHADDEQLFFAGLLPYYAGERQLAVQVAYFTNHNGAPKRRHEQLDGLWAVGVRHYPVIGALPDLYSESKQQALRSWEKHGFTEQEIVAAQTALLRRFRPQVVVGHDIAGEYGHGAHILNTDTLLQALSACDDAAQFPESAKTYGAYRPKKVYLHLYEKNPVIMDWDTPLACFGGRTAYEVSREGFGCHTSQHWTWFKTWLLGTDARPIAKAAEIQTYSPCRYGLYYTAVGPDVTGNDLFENLTSYAEQAAQEEARRLAEAEAEQKRARAAQQAEQQAAQIRRRNRGIGIAAAVILLTALAAALLWKRKRSKKAAARSHEQI